MSMALMFNAWFRAMLRFSSEKLVGDGSIATTLPDGPTGVCQHGVVTDIGADIDKHPTRSKRGLDIGGHLWPPHAEQEDAPADHVGQRAAHSAGSDPSREAQAALGRETVERAPARICNHADRCQPRQAATALFYEIRGGIGATRRRPRFATGLWFRVIDMINRTFEDILILLLQLHAGQQTSAGGEGDGKV